MNSRRTSGSNQNQNRNASSRKRTKTKIAKQTHATAQAYPTNKPEPAAYFIPRSPAAVFSRAPRTRRTGYIPATAAVARAAGRRFPSPPHLCPRAVVTISILVRAAPTMAVRLPAILLSSICLLVLLNGMVMHGYRVFHLRYSIYSSFIVSCS